jgi:hypothetical protein
LTDRLLLDAEEALSQHRYKECILICWGRIEQGEQVDIAVTITNTGKQDALNAEVQLSTTIPNVVISKRNQSIGALSPNKPVTVTFPVTIPRGVPAGAFPLEVKVTHFFLKGLRGEADGNGDKAISASEIDLYISDKSTGVPYYAKLAGKEQTPVTMGDTARIVVQLK